MDTTDIDKVFQKFPNQKREDLIPILQAVQDEFGYLSSEVINEVGRYLGMSENKIYGVATFYDNFRFTSRGRHHFRLCHGTACHVAGASTILKELEKLIKVSEGETGEDGLFSLEVVSCMGACGLAPLIQVNDKFYTNITLDSLKEIVVSIRKKDKASI